MNTAKRRTAGPSTRTGVFIVDDHPLIRQGLTQLFATEHDLEVVGEAGSAAEAITGIRDTKPHLVLVDLTLTDTGGIELIKEIRAQWPKIIILVASMHTDTLYAERSMRAGAAGYITKNAPHQEILSAVRTVLKDRIYLNPRMSDELLHRVLDKNEDKTRDPVESLSDRELEVFELLGQGLRTRDIADRLSLSVKTIETYRDNIRVKLSVDNSTELIHRATRWKLEREG